MKSSSPYSNTPVANSFMGIWKRKSLPPSANDGTILTTGRHEHRPDLLSYDLYGTADYWWVFCARNIDQIRDPIFDLKAGMTIYVPSLDRIKGLNNG